MDLLRLVFRCEGGGDGGKRVETMKRTTSGSRLNARKVVVGQRRRNDENNHLQLVFEREGGGSSGSRVEMTKTTTSNSCLNVREVVVVGVVSKR